MGFERHTCEVANASLARAGQEFDEEAGRSLGTEGRPTGTGPLARGEEGPSAQLLMEPARRLGNINERGESIAVGVQPNQSQLNSATPEQDSGHVPGASDLAQSNGNGSVPMFAGHGTVVNGQAPDPSEIVMDGSTMDTPA